MCDNDPLQFSQKQVDDCCIIQLAHKVSNVVKESLKERKRTIQVHVRMVAWQLHETNSNTTDATYVLMLSYHIGGKLVSNPDPNLPVTSCHYYCATVEHTYTKTWRVCPLRLRNSSDAEVRVWVRD